MLKSLLPDSLHRAIPFLQPYVLTSFGSFIRIDYGTGHELSFVVFLLCLHKIGFLSGELEVERRTVLDVFVKYVHLSSQVGYNRNLFSDT
jgi:serine/threonine-protein phosphatase 2A activator